MIEPRRIQANTYPQTIQKLGNGSYYYNYDIQEVEVEVSKEGSELGTEIETQYSFIQVYLTGQPNYKDCVKAIIRAFIKIDEEFDLINSYNSYTQQLSSDESVVEEYNEYLTLLSQIKTKVKEDFAKS